MTGRGRPSYQPTLEHRSVVEAMCGYGIPTQNIAEVIGVSKQTLFKHFKKELQLGQTKANAKVVEALFKLATQKLNPAAAIFWCKTRLGWRESGESSGMQIRPEKIEIIVAPKPED